MGVYRTFPGCLRPQRTELDRVFYGPINALAFATDGIHWGTGDFRFLRNVMISATVFGGIAIYLLDESASGALTRIWIITGCWITIRAGFGVLRIWPGLGKCPLKKVTNPPK